MIQTRKITRTFEPPTGERLSFSIGNNGARKWNQLDEETKAKAMLFFDACAEYVSRMRAEIESIPTTNP